MLIIKSNSTTMLDTGLIWTLMTYKIKYTINFWESKGRGGIYKYLMVV